MSAMAARGIPKLEAGPQKSVVRIVSVLILSYEMSFRYGFNDGKGCRMRSELGWGSEL
jgi:hypothetical protein